VLGCVALANLAQWSGKNHSCFHKAAAVPLRSSPPHTISTSGLLSDWLRLQEGLQAWRDRSLTPCVPALTVNPLAHCRAGLETIPSQLLFAQLSTPLHYFSRRFRKKSCKSAAHSFCKTPDVISHRWFKPGICSRFITLPAAPAAKSAHPKITRRIRVCTTAPAHIAHGSLVT
jgi:hypothetical protein